MRQSKSYEEVKALIARYFRPGIQTNGVPSGDILEREIRQGSLTVHDYEGGLLLVRSRSTHSLLSYLITDAAAVPEVTLPPDTVVEIPFRPGAAHTLPPLLEAQGFSPLFSRLRMKHGKSSGDPTPLPHCPFGAEEVMAVLTACFDKTTACLPTPEELGEEIAAGRILTAAQDGALAGVLRMREQGNTMELRHLAVLPQYRGQAIGRHLTEAFVSAFPQKILHVWVRQDYPAPQHIYQKTGFIPDGYESIVLKKGV